MRRILAGLLLVLAYGLSWPVGSRAEGISYRVANGNDGVVSGGTPGAMTPPLVGDGVAAQVDVNCATGRIYTGGQWQSLSNAVTVTRTTTFGVAYADDTYGNWHAFADNTLRQTNKGCLIEETRTQVVPNTTGAGWTFNNMASTLGQASPAGTMDAFLLTTSVGGSNVHNGYMGSTVTASATLTASVFFKYNGMRYVNLTLGDGGPVDFFYATADLVAGVITQTGTAGTATIAGSGITVYQNGWIRVSVTGVVGAQTAVYPILTLDLPTGTTPPGTAVPGTGTSVYVWCPQIEAGTFPTSPIPTNSGPGIVRNADGVRLSSAPVPTTALTTFAQGVPNAPATYTYQIMLYVGDGTASNRVDIGKQTGVAQGMLLSTVGSIAGGAWVSGATMKIAGAASSGSGTSNGALNGVLLGADQAATGTFTGMSNTTIGSDASSGYPFNGYLQRVAIWPNTRVSDAGLLALTGTSGVLAGPDNVTGTQAQASVDLNFAANTGFNQGTVGNPGPMVADSRTTTGSLGSYAQDSSGNWLWFADNTARVTNQGLLNEEGRTNLVFNASTLAINGFGPGAGIAGTGVSTDLPLLFPGAVVWKSIYGGSGDTNVGANYGSITIAPSTTYTISVWIYVPKGTAATSVTVSTEGPGDLPSGLGGSANLALTNQWQKVTQTATSSATGSTGASLVFRITGPAGSYAYYTAPQIEAGAFPTSFIANTALAVATRSADNITLAGLTGSSTLTSYAQMGLQDNGGNNASTYVYSSLNSSANIGGQRLQISTGGGNPALVSGVVSAASVNLFVQGYNGSSTYNINRMALATDTATQGFSVNGSAAQLGATAGTVTGVNELNVGNEGGGFWISGYIQRVAVWLNNRISNAGLAALTATPGIMVGDGVQAQVDLNFVANTGYNWGTPGLTGTATSMLAMSRATTNNAAYIDDTSGNWHLVTDNLPRISNKGLLVEEQRVQLITNTTATTNWANPGQLTTGQASPDGGTGAFLFANDGTNNPNFTYIGTVVPTGTLAISAFYKYAGSQYNAIIVGDGALSQAMWVNFDIINGVITTTGTSGASAITGTGITVYPNGWVRVWISGTIGGSPTTIIPVTSIALASGTTPPGPPGTTGRGKNILIWCPQIEAGPFPTSPIPNTTLNTITRGADDITLSPIPGPTTYNPMTMVVYGQAESLNLGSNTWVPGSWTAATGYNDSVYFTEQSVPALAYWNGVTGGTGQFLMGQSPYTTNFKLAGSTATNSNNMALNGVTAGRDTTHSPTAAAITTIGIGSLAGAGNWSNSYITRFALIRNSVSDTGLVALTSTPGVLTDGVTTVQSSIDLNCRTDTAFWQGSSGTVEQFVTASHATTPTANQSTILNDNGSYSLVNDNVLRRSSAGCLIEEQRSNGILNNSMQNAVAGTPGVLPTQWNYYGGPGAAVTSQIVGVGNLNGIDYIDLRFFGIGPASGSIVISEDGGGGNIPASIGQTWTGSVFLAMVGGSTTNISGFYLQTYSIASNLGGLSAYTLAIGTTLPSTLTRYSYSFTITDVNAAFVLPWLPLIGVSIGQPFDVTVRVGWPQMELNSNIYPAVASGNQTIVGNGTSGCTAATTNGLNVAGGTQSPVNGAVATVNVTAAGGVVTQVAQATAGAYSVFPPTPATISGVPGCIGPVTVNLTPANGASSGWASSPIRTSGSAVTRAFDQVKAVVTAPTYAATLFVQARLTDPNTVTNKPYNSLGSLNDGVGNNELELDSPSSNGTQAGPNGGQYVYVATPPGSLAQSCCGAASGAGNPVRGSVATTAGNQRSAFNGSVTGASGSLAFNSGTMNALTLGWDPRFGTLNGVVERITLWNNFFITQPNQYPLTLAVH